MNNIMKTLKKLLNSRSIKYGSNSIVLVVAVVAIAVFINVLVGMAGLKWDLTANKLFSIGPETKTILTGLNKEVTIYGLFDEEKGKNNTELKEVMELVNQYKKFSNIKVVYQDPDKDPSFIKNLDPDNVKELKLGDFVVKSGSKLRKIEKADLFSTEFNPQTFSSDKTGSVAEQSLTGAIKFVISEKTPTIYFTEGHEENKVDSDLKATKDILQRNNYEVKSLNLLTEGKVPADAEVVVMAAPKKDLAVAEKEKLQEYLKNGGKAIFMVDAITADTSLSKLNELLKDYNLAVNYDRVKETDTSRKVNKDRDYDFVPFVQDSAVTSGLNTKDMAVLFSNARSINIFKNQKETLTVTSLIKSSSKAIGEIIDKSKGRDTNGPLDLAVAAEDKGSIKPSKVIVMGSSIFLTDNVLKQFTTDGMYLFMGSLTWMQDKKDDVYIAPKAYSTPKLDKLTQLSTNLSALFVVILLPLAIFAMGTFVWMRRRHL